MKKHHVILILLLVGIAAVLLIETRKLKSGEAITSEELNLLREAVKKSPGVTASTRTGRNNRPPAIDARKFTDELTEFLKAGPGSAKGKGLDEFMTAYESQLKSAPLAKLKEICELLEKNFPFDQPDTEGAQLVWLGVLRLAAKSDPAWAFAKLDQASSTTKISIQMQLGMFKNSRDLTGNPMGHAYATAMQKWLDAAQAAGRIEKSDPLVAGLRIEIAAAQGNQPAAVQQLSKLPYLSQQQAAIDYAESLQTPEAQRQAMEELSTALHIQNFPHFVSKLAELQGFDAARVILSSASLTPENHDLAAASIAASNIGPETLARATWLLDSLRSDDPRALSSFADQWAHADYQEAAKWMNSIPSGPKRDAAVSGFAPAAAKVDGASAVDWALTISDPIRRASCLSDAYQKWKMLEPEAAANYLKQKGADAESH